MAAHRKIVEVLLVRIRSTALASSAASDGLHQPSSFADSSVNSLCEIDLLSPAPQYFPASYRLFVELGQLPAFLRRVSFCCLE